MAQSIPNYYFDLSGLFNVQKHMLMQAPADTNGTIINGVSSNLQKLHSNFVDSNTNINGILDHQSEMNQIILAETERLNKKQSDIDSAIMGKQRALVLNESHRLRYKQIFKIIFVIVLTLSLFITIAFLSKMYPYVPSAVFEVASIIVLTVGIIWIYFLTIDLLQRSHTYFDELYIMPPVQGNTMTASSSAAYSYYTDPTFSLTPPCIDANCCSEGTVWDAGNVVCVGDHNATLNPINKNSRIHTVATIPIDQNMFSFDTFTTIKGTRQVKPNSPNEFSDYTLLTQ